jgi:hypothetical protein
MKKLPRDAATGVLTSNWIEDQKRQKNKCLQCHTWPKIAGNEKLMKNHTLLAISMDCSVLSAVDAATARPLESEITLN